MENFAERLLEEKDLIKKMEMVYYLSRRVPIFFDNSVIVKAELAKMFLEKEDIKVDHNMVLSACLVYACKKPLAPQNLDKIKEYPKESSKYLEVLGFSVEFCDVCEGHNRYIEKPKRANESDVLELVDQFGGMILNRPERIGFSPDEALCLLVNRNLKGKNNQYIERFNVFAESNGAVSLPEDEVFKETPFSVLQAIGNGVANKIVPKKKIEDRILETITRIGEFEEWYQTL